MIHAEPGHALHRFHLEIFLFSIEKSWLLPNDGVRWSCSHRYNSSENIFSKSAVRFVLCNQAAGFRCLRRHTIATVLCECARELTRLLACTTHCCLYNVRGHGVNVTYNCFPIRCLFHSILSAAVSCGPSPPPLPLPPPPPIARRIHTNNWITFYLFGNKFDRVVEPMKLRWKNWI